MLPMRPMKLGGEFIIFGENSLEYLSQLEGNRKKAFIVRDGDFLEQHGFLDEIVNLLGKGGFEVDDFNEVEPDPSIETVNKGVKKMLAFEPDWIIAVGGGSVMDAAKAMWIIYEHPHLKSIADITNPIPKLRKKAKMVNIPTSSGTGSEVSRSIVITDPSTHTKHGIGDMEMMPDIAILEPKLTATLPKSMTAATGMDAFTHSIEARTSRRANSLADALADKAIKDIFENILTAYNDPKNLKARENMLVASMISGMAFTNVSLGIVHSLAHAFGGKFGVPHGIANAIILPYVMEYNTQDQRADDIYKEISNNLDTGKSLITIVNELNKQMDIPPRLKDLINKDETFDSLLNELAELAKADGCTKTNPILPSIDEFKELFKVCYYGS
ncbi:iron-containing alcohol dehydrogenase [Amphibacillus sp. Q70]|uniref:iron-containing alcohol dehydrogenase n=1 Tax=Amphibacillus sp. Q70 TaxID=3453416 RepID=UPI003F87BDE1